MIAGRVVSWHERGYGFVAVDGLDRDVFVHVTTLQKAGLGSSLPDGQRVRLEYETVPKGPIATAIELVSDEEGADAALATP